MSTKLKDVSEAHAAGKLDPAKLRGVIENKPKRSPQQETEGVFVPSTQYQPVPANMANNFVWPGDVELQTTFSGIDEVRWIHQMAAFFAAGREAFGIPPARPLKVLIIQAEDDEGDCIEMSLVVNHLELSSDQKEMVGKNTNIVPVDSAVSEKFLEIVDTYPDVWPADIVILNPYTAYLGADEKDSEANTKFLRNGLNPILTKHKCAAIIIHHTPKTNFNSTKDYKPSDWMYRGAGTAIITNWARAYLVIDPTAVPGVFRFIAAKRGKRIGWQKWERFFKHSSIPGIMRWEEADDEEIALARQTNKRIKIADSEILLKLVPVSKAEQKEILIQKGIGETKCGRDKVKAQFAILEQNGKIFPRLIRNPSGKGRSLAGWSQTQEPEPEFADLEPDMKT